MARQRRASTVRPLIHTSALAVLFAALVAAPGGVARADSIRDKQWHLDYLRISEAHEISQGEGVTVAVLDTGVDPNHPDLKGAVREGRTFASGDSGWQDSTGHGTAMATLIAGRGHGPGNRDGVLGVAPKAKILPVRVTSPGGYHTDALHQGITWATEHGADIISISLSGIDDPDVEDAINTALDNNILVIAGAGNTADGDHGVTWPARYPGVIAVSGVDQDGNFTGISARGPQIALSAPATQIMAGGTAKRGRYGQGSGTSDATALVAGTAALIKSRHPRLDLPNVINRLIATADDQGPEGRDAEYGYGVIDPVAALTREVPRVSRNPLLSPTSTRSGTSTRSAPAARTSAGSWAMAGLVGLVAVAVVALLVLRAQRRTRRRREG